METGDQDGRAPERWREEQARRHPLLVGKQTRGWARTGPRGSASTAPRTPARTSHQSAVHWLLLQSKAVRTALPGVRHGSKRPANQQGPEGPRSPSHASSSGAVEPLPPASQPQGASAGSSQGPRCFQQWPQSPSRPRLKHPTMPHLPHSSDGAARPARIRGGDRAAETPRLEERRHRQQPSGPCTP